jgi:MFS transporter, PHS family, inorganic phosphate transporter
LQARGLRGDYPVNAALMSEFSGKKSRAMTVSLVFALQAAGLVFAMEFATSCRCQGSTFQTVICIQHGTFAVPCRWLIGGKGNNENRSNCPFNGKRSA